MTWLTWLTIALLVATFAALTGIKPNDSRPVAHTRLMGMARLVLVVAVLIVVALALTGCDNQRSTKDEPARADPTEQSKGAPTRTGYANGNGARFYYQIYGDLDSQQTPLLVLHGSYMSSDAMAPLIRPFAASRPVIALDARGHGRTGDLPSGITYDQMADDAVAVLNDLEVRSADVLGYSMGAITAITMAVRHPGKTGKQIILSGVASRDGWYPEVHAALAQATPDAFAGSPLQAEYTRLSPTPNAFPVLVSELRTLDASNYDSSDDAVRRIDGKTLIVVGDADAVQLEYAIKLFRLRGGGDKKVAVQGFMTEAPRARLAVLPGTAHVGIMANADLIAEVAIPFLDDSTPRTPPGFFPEGK
jgi:pimeloyl-ACP methyl ester carboxylesterase